MLDPDKDTFKESQQLDIENNNSSSKQPKSKGFFRRIRIYVLVILLLLLILISVISIINVIVGNKIQETAKRYGCDVTWSSLRYNIINKNLHINGFNSYCKKYGDLQASKLSIYGLSSTSEIPPLFIAKVYNGTFKVSPVLLTLYPEIMDSPYFNTYNGNFDLSVSTGTSKDAVTIEAKFELLGLGDLLIKLKIDTFLGMRTSNFIKNLEYGNIRELLIGFKDTGLANKLIYLFADPTYNLNTTPKKRVLSGIDKRMKSPELTPHQRDLYMQVYRFLENPGMVTLRLESLDAYTLNKMFSYKITGLRTALYWFSTQPFVVTSY